VRRHLRALGVADGTSIASFVDPNEPEGLVPLPDGAIVVAAESSPGLVELTGGATQAVGSLTDLDEAIPDDGLVYVTDLGTDEVRAVDPTPGASRVLVTGSPSPRGWSRSPTGAFSSSTRPRR
jgi:hypothetical protein